MRISPARSRRQAEREEARTTISNLREDLKVAADTHVIDMAERVRLGQAHTAALNALQESQQKLREAEATRDRVISELAGTVTELDKLRLDVEKAGNQAQRLLEEAEKASRQVIALNEQMHALHDDNDTLGQELVKAREELTLAASREAALQAELDSLKKAPRPSSGRRPKSPA